MKYLFALAALLALSTFSFAGHYCGHSAVAIVGVPYQPQTVSLSYAPPPVTVVNATPPQVLLSAPAPVIVGTQVLVADYNTTLLLSTPTYGNQIFLPFSNSYGHYGVGNGNYGHNGNRGNGGNHGRR